MRRHRTLTDPSTCSNFDETALRAGPLSLSSSSFQGQVAPAAGNLHPLYEVVLPPGTIGAGAFTVSSGGGPDVGAFQTVLDIPAPPIEILTNLASGTVFDSQQDLVINWKPGAIDGFVQVEATSPGMGAGAADLVNGSTSRETCGARISDGHVELSTCGSYPKQSSRFGGQPLKIVITVSPDRSAIQTFTAGGLTLSGFHRWQYVCEFDGMKW